MGIDNGTESLAHQGTTKTAFMNFWPKMLNFENKYLIITIMTKLLLVYFNDFIDTNIKKYKKQC